MKRNLIVLIVVGMIVLYAYISEKFFRPDNDTFKLENYRLNTLLSKRVEKDVHDIMYLNLDSISIKFYDKIDSVDSKYVSAYLKVNKDYFTTTEVYQNNYMNPFLDGVMKTITHGSFIVDVRFHYKVGDREIDRKEHMKIHDPTENNKMIEN